MGFQHNVVNIRQPYLWCVWAVCLALWVGLLLIPVSYRSTRFAAVALLAIVWFGLIALTWQYQVARFGLLTVTLIGLAFLLAPLRHIPPVETLRADYVSALQRYRGVQYYWGGESFRGIDCSGLTRRGLIDSLFLRGLTSGKPELVRRSLYIWWNDCTAAALGNGMSGLTEVVLETPSLNELDHSRILPGDMAVTRSGLHVMAYLGDMRWIEADPMEGKVIEVTAPSGDNVWFHGPMKIVRWQVLR